jgi:hypothetical protein
MMPTLYGRNYNINELKRLTSTLDALAGIRLVEYSDGKARGMRVADVWTGSGLRFTVWLDRALDIGPAEFAGKPLAWLHPALGTSAQYEPAAFGWLRTFGGGLVTTCGLTFFGQAEKDKGEDLGLHGRISHIPAEQVSVHTGWQGDNYILSIEGQARQSVLFGENLLLTRRISTALGATSFLIEDTVRNEGYRSAPHMLLYHCNFGFPVVSPESELQVNDESIGARDAATQAGLDRHTHFEPPVEAYREQVFFHKPCPDALGLVTASLINRALNFGAFVRYRAAELPALSQWKNMGAGEYVCALEPCTVHETPRTLLREQSNLKMLEPGEEIHYLLELGVANPG